MTNKPELFPSVACESQTRKIPVFHVKNLSIGSQNSLSTLSLKSFSPLQRSQSEDTISSCRCPNVLIADDDDFQEFYYQMLFDKTLDYAKLNIDKTEFRFKIFKSGEDLLKSYQKIKKCGCDTLTLVISDYNMGEKNLNGVETAFKLRQMGFSENIALRTSEERDYLCRQHNNLNEMLRLKEIDCILDKTSHANTKKAVEGFLKTT